MVVTYGLHKGPFKGNQVYKWLISLGAPGFERSRFGAPSVGFEDSGFRVIKGYMGLY